MSAQNYIVAFLKIELASIELRLQALTAMPKEEQEYPFSVLLDSLKTKRKYIIRLIEELPDRYERIEDELLNLAQE